MHGNLQWENGRPTVGHRKATEIIEQRLRQWLEHRHAYPGQTIYIWGKVARWEGMSIPHMLALYNVVHVNEANRLYALGAPIYLQQVA
ncbi:hypothetical protein [Acinetobacter sp.]|uniref:hypothetical protein n=1 Tax=Acinetobacter sp. TaxID=472 RepID=UPI00374FDC37